jgi:hypothetical protein
MGRNAVLDKEEEDGEKEEDGEVQEGRPRLKFHPETTSTRCIPPMTTVFNSAFREWSNAEKKTNNNRQSLQPMCHSTTITILRTNHCCSKDGT